MPIFKRSFFTYTDGDMVRTRIAPSPTGFPHVGTIYQAIFNLALVKKYGGSFVLRLEDTDRQRFVEGSETVIYQSLDWVGIKVAEGPREGGAFGPYRQSERLAIYKKLALQLIESESAYYCFCSQERLIDLRKRQEELKKSSIYDKLCRSLPREKAAARVSAGEPYIIRLKIPEDKTIIVVDSIRGEISFDSNLIDDAVLLKSDGFPTYHLALVVDDHLMEITHPIRGEEWISSYPKHKLLYDYFGWEMPIYTHLPLLKNPDGTKISKRHGHTSVNWYKDEGILPEALVNFLVSLVWKHPQGKEVFTLEEFATFFEFKDISLAGPRFDLKKLEWLNGEYIRQTPDSKLKDLIYDFYHGKFAKTTVERVAPIVKERIKKLSEFESLAGFLFAETISFELGLTFNKGLIGKAFEVLGDLENWQSPIIESALRKLTLDLKVKPGELFTSVRNAVAGQKVTPPLFESLEILGKERTLERLKRLI